ncbi:MAG TPA: DUF2877 domain-containing protein [Solirubrobacteraceae bacterium]|nr:DUF2877 domain-containing protein [Solirubrobacteraceae bacterium]
MIAARPVLERLAGRRVKVAGAGRDAAYVEDGGFVAVLTVARPALPNGVQVARLPRAGEEIVVDGGDEWDPALEPAADPAALDARISAAVGHPPESLVRAIRSADGKGLVGRGPGLTPEGDDLVAGAAAVLAAAGHGGRAAALVGTDLRRRTTTLSATLLELSTVGMGPEPLQALLAGDPAALARLLRLGHSTGRAYALGAAAALAAE